MKNSAQVSGSSLNKGVMHYVHHSLVFVVAFLVILAETISVVLLRQQLHLQSNLIIYILPLLVLLPCVEGIRMYRKMRTEFAASGRGETVPSTLGQTLAVTVGLAYVVLIFALVLLVDCLRSGIRLP